MNFIMTEHDRVVAAYKEYLPAKSIKNGYPQILWIQAPYHDNFVTNDLRYKLNRCIEEVSRFHNQVHMLELKCVWDPKNKYFFIHDSQHFTTLGYHAYWEAVDPTIRYFDSVVLKKAEKRKLVKNDNRSSYPKGGGNCSDQKDQRRNYGQKDRFRWKNPRFNTDPEAEAQIF